MAEPLKIVLCCANGASTDMLGLKIAEAAKKKGIEAVVEAHPIAQLDTYMDHVDILILAPQVKHKMKAITEQYGNREGLYITTVTPVDYGMMRGEKVLDELLAATNRK